MIISLGFGDELEKIPDPNEHYVTVLYGSNFEKAVQENKYLIVDMYANWCGHCIDFAPEFSKLGKYLQEKGIKDVEITAAKIDLAAEDQERQIGPKYGVQYYPTVIFFMDGVPITHPGGAKTGQGLYQWIKDLFKQPPILELKSESQIDNFINDNQFSTIYFGIDDPKSDMRYWPFVDLAYTQEGNDEQIAFAFVRDDGDLIQKYAQNRGTIMAYKFNENNELVSRKFTQQHSKDNLQKFYLQLVLSTVISYDEKADKILSNNQQSALVLFVNSNEQSRQAEQEFVQVAKKYGNKYLFFISRVTDANFWTRLEQIGKFGKDFPQLFLIQSKIQGQKIKYQYTFPQFDVQHYEQYIQSYEQGNLKRIWRSGDQPEKNDGQVKVIVGDTFLEEVHKDNVDVVVYMYTSDPNCVQCQATQPIVEQVAWKFRNNRNIKFVKINMDDNDIPLTTLHLPMVYYFKNQQKRSPIHYETDLKTPKDLIEFIRDHSTFTF